MISNRLKISKSIDEILVHFIFISIFTDTDLYRTSEKETEYMYITVIRLAKILTILKQRISTYSSSKGIS